MNSKQKTFTRGREWLNPLGHDDTGAISWEVTAQLDEVLATVQVRDCSKQIELNFGVFDYGFSRKPVVKQLEQRKKKLQKIIRAFELVLENLDDAYEFHVEEKRKYKERQDKRKEAAKKPRSVP